MRGYTTREVADLLGLSSERIRAFARAGFLTPERGERNEYRFSFEDIVLLRTAREMEKARIHPRKLWRALRALKAELPAWRQLTSLRIVADGANVLVRDGGAAWQPESGQVTFDFAVADIAEGVAPIIEAARREAADTPDATSADWYAIGADLEAIGNMKEARQAYWRAIDLDPGNVNAQINLGRLCHAEGHLSDAEAHYRRAIAADPADATAWFNLGVALEDMAQNQRATEAYERAIAADPDAADAHFNLARLYEEAGKRPAAFRHFARYRSLVR